MTNSTNDREPDFDVDDSPQNKESSSSESSTESSSSELSAETSSSEWSSDALYQCVKGNTAPILHGENSTCGIMASNASDTTRLIRGWICGDMALMLQERTEEGWRHSWIFWKRQLGYCFDSRRYHCLEWAKYVPGTEFARKTMPYNTTMDNAFAPTPPHIIEAFSQSPASRPVTLFRRIRDWFK